MVRVRARAGAMGEGEGVGEDEGEGEGEGEGRWSAPVGRGVKAAFATHDVRRVPGQG